MSATPPIPLSSSSSSSSAYTRRDGRTAIEIRGKEMRLSDMAEFDGSSWYAQGQTAVMVSLHGPTLAKNEEYDTCMVRVRVQHARGLTPSAGGAERAVYEEMKFEVLTRTDALELESLLESTIDAVVMSDRFPRCVLVVDVVVVQDDGSLPAVALNAVMCALLDAGVPCRTTMAAVCVAAVTCAEAGRHGGAEEAGGSSLELLLDPTTAEESLGGGYASAAAAGGKMNIAASAVAEKGDLSGQAGSNLSLVQSGVSQAQPGSYRCVSSGVFVFSNPACGGGLLAQLMRRRSGAERDGSGSAGGVVSLEVYGQMMTLAERAAGVLFDFFRQCNVAD